MVGKPPVRWAGLGGFGALWLLEVTYSLPASGNFRPDLRLTFIGGGEALIPLLEGATAISRVVSVLFRRAKTSPSNGPPPVYKPACPYWPKPQPPPARF